MKHDCTCFSQQERRCPVHPMCACGCPRMAHVNEGIGECQNFASMLRPCHGCPEYRPASRQAYRELDDVELDEIVGVGGKANDPRLEIMRAAYRELRAHHIEETTVLYARALAFPANARAFSVDDTNSEHYMRMLQIRDIDIDHVCQICMGFGTRMYSSGATWRGGMGTSNMPIAICDQCWGSGSREKPWLDLRTLRDKTAEDVAERAVDALARSCGATFQTTGKSIRQIITHLDALQRKRKVGNEPVDFWMLPLANGLANILRRAIGDPEWDWNKDKPPVVIPVRDPAGRR